MALFQTNEGRWSDPVLPQGYRHETSSRLRLIRGELHIREPGGEFGPYRPRPEAISRFVTRLTAASSPGLALFIANTRGKGVRARVVERDQPFGYIYPTVGDCRDNYPNMVVEHNLAGQMVKLQSPAMLAYHEAERLLGRPIRITGIGWRSCASQRALYASDPGRFADPDYSRHCRGLAIDVENTPANLNSRSHNALVAVGFCFGVSGEPWHAAYSECG